MGATANIAAISQEAFVYGYPTVDLYNILYQYTADPAAPEYKAPLNAIYNTRHVATPEDRAIVAMNCDTPYSYAWLGPARRANRAHAAALCAGSLPVADAGRSLHLHRRLCQPAHQRQRRRDFLVAGPGWTGETPPGIKAVFRSPTELALAFYRTQLFDAADIDAVRRLQDQFGVQPLSAYLGAPTPPAAPPLAWCKPLDVRKEPASLHFFSVLNWMLQYMPVLEDERELRGRLASIGVQAAAQFTAPEATERAALVQGMQAGQQAMVAFLRTVKSSAELFGSRAELCDRYINRAAGAMVGILGNSAQEFLGIGYQGDAEGQQLDGSHTYRIKFGPHDLPPVKAFWSITLYDASMLLYPNPLHRYVINSPMLDQLVRDADGGFTLYVQHTSPGAEKEANWLPAPEGRFNLTFRTYQPGPAILDGSYHAPPVVKIR